MSGHIWIASYYFVPLLAVILAVLPSKIPPFFLQQKKKLQISFFNKQSLFVVLSLFLAGLGEAYFMFFFCFLCIIAGIYAYYKNNRSGYHLVSALIILGIAIASTLINILPQLLYQSEHGENPLIAPRYPIESEIVGLKLTNLVLPSNNHRSQTARIIKQAYQPFPQKVEGDGESLGIIGLIGFLFLLSLPLFAKKEEEENINNRLSIFTIASILFATVGGGSAIFALFITPTIRSHNRISIFIACFAFFALASLLQQYKSKMPKPLLYTILGIILTIGIWDQTNSSARITQPHKTEYLSDKAFISQIESSVPEASSIFQLPFAPYIGSPVIHKMNDYSHFKGYLHSKNLNWSYGAVRGRPQGNWYQSTANMPIQKIIPTLRNAGFSGIYIDRFGYPDNGTQIEKTLQQQLQTSPITSSNNRLSFWKL
jgi:phosphoglycerol transferase